MSKFLFDTNVCIYFLEGNQTVTEFMKKTLRDPRNCLVLSVITEAELFSSRRVWQFRVK